MLAAVGLEPYPRVPAPGVADGRPPARGAIVEGANKAVQVAAGVQPPRARQFHVGVDVRAEAGWQPLGGPVAPVIQVHVRPAIGARRLVELKSEPVAELLFIRTRLKPQVVDLEPRREAVVHGLEAGISAADLRE